MFSIASWNVNSLKVRLPHVLEWLKTKKPDVLALQEIKMINDDFPHEIFREQGYEAIVSGQKAYNGVAILTRHAHENVLTDIVNYADPQRRVLAATINDLRILNLYIPNGEGLLSPKYQYKMEWLENLESFIAQEISTHSKMIILGDFNIAPEEIDVHDPAAWAGKILVSSPERNAFKNILDIGFKDCYRLHYPSEKNFSWWDYRLNAFKRNIGCRIDHILSSEAIATHCNYCEIDPTPRGWERPSDHAPIYAEFNI